MWPAPERPPEGPLAGIRVLDLSRILAGPFSTQILADLGADVIKVERAGEGDETRRWGPPYAPSGDAAYFYACNRGRRSIALDLRGDEDRSVVLSLVADADVLVENFLPGAMDRLGLSDGVLAGAQPAARARGDLGLWPGQHAPTVAGARLRRPGPHRHPERDRT